MKSPSSRALLVALSLSTSGCSNVLGLNDLEEVDCVGASCADAAVDGSMDTTIADTMDAADDGAEVAIDAVVDGADSAADAPTDGGGDAGCEAGITSCGACDRACSTANVASAVCSGGLCEPTCQAGFGNCTTPAAPSADDGCETKLDTITNCAGCGNKCDTSNSVGATCTAATCVYTGCKPGWADCNTTAPDLDGCETAIGGATGCGGCGKACDTVHSLSATCSGGTTCSYMGCAAGYGDCNATPPNIDGCETALDTITNCGACGVKCDTTTSVGAACVGGKCVYSGCAAGFGDCNTVGSNANGCETALDTISDCGVCGGACDTAKSVGAACSMGKCTYTGCKSGFGDCMKTGADHDGCETSLTTTANCGACGSACDTTSSTGATCNGTTCLYTGCVAGKLDCNKTAPNTAGCESNSTSTSSCGGCGNVCSAATGTPSCSGTTCSYACNAGRADCNSATSPDTDGCECASSSAAATGTVGGCCGTGCQTQHDNGVGQSFYDCVALSTYNSTQAMEACRAYTNDATGANCHTIDCGGGTGSTLVVCNDTGTQKCMCWEYKGANAGYVFVGSAAGACGCPSSKTTAWK